MRKTDKSVNGLTGRSYNIFGGHDETEDGLAAVFWSGLFSYGTEFKKLIGRILPPDTPAIYPNHRKHGPPYGYLGGADYSEGDLTFPGMCKDIRKVSDLTRKMGLRKLISVYNSISCPPGLADLIYSAKNDLPRQDATIFISPPDEVPDYLPPLIKLGCAIARNRIPEPAANFYYEIIKWLARKEFKQIDSDARIRFMNIEHDPKGILLGLDGFPCVSEQYPGEGDELEGHATMVIYGDHDGVIKKDGIHRFIKTLERRGADVTVVSMDSGHRVTAPNNDDNLRGLEVSVDLEKVAYLRGVVSRWLNEKGILAPCGEEDLMTMERRVEKYSGGSETELCLLDIENHFEGDGVPLYMT